MSILTRKIHSTHFSSSVYRINLFSILILKKSFVRFGKSLCKTNLVLPYISSRLGQDEISSSPTNSSYAQ